MRLTTQRNGQHHITIPDRGPLRAGTLASVLFKTTLLKVRVPPPFLLKPLGGIGRSKPPSIA
jgi:hypothetical protein